MQFDIVTTAQVERTYVVTADDEKQARDRLRIFLKDSELLREGLVEKLAEEKNVTPEKIKSAAKVAITPPASAPVPPSAAATPADAKKK